MTFTYYIRGAAPRENMSSKTRKMRKVRFTPRMRILWRMILLADNEGPDQTARRQVFAWRGPETLSCGIDKMIIFH